MARKGRMADHGSYAHAAGVCGGDSRARKPACAASQRCACCGWSDNARHSNAMQMILTFVSFA
ncbi:hypothetical protein C6T53_01005 [Burkholderia multivorans]|nr:hypothetical protein C6T53_01005 [Burkholderia multivorans]